MAPASGVRGANAKPDPTPIGNFQGIYSPLKNEEHVVTKLPAARGLCTLETKTQKTQKALSRSSDRSPCETSNRNPTTPPARTPKRRPLLSICAPPETRGPYIPRPWIELSSTGTTRSKGHHSTLVNSATLLNTSPSNHSLPWSEYNTPTKGSVWEQLDFLRGQRPGGGSSFNTYRA